MKKYPQKRYGSWAGNPGGNPYIPERCAKEVIDYQSCLLHQCTRKKGHGLDGLFCKQHAKLCTPQRAPNNG